MIAVVLLGACVDQAQPQSGYNAGYNQNPAYYQNTGYNPNGAPPAPTNASPGYAPAPSAPAPIPAPAPAPAPYPTGASPAPAPTNPAPAGTAPGGFPWPFPFPMPGAAPGGDQPNAAGAATPIDPSLAQAAILPLLAYAQQEAPGMQREGNPVAAQFKEGQTLETPFQMLPGKCYTVLAVGAGIQEVDVQIIALTPVPGLNPVLAQDSGTGDRASVGGRGSCYKWIALFGINARYIITATRGQGLAAGQLYIK